MQQVDARSRICRVCQAAPTAPSDAYPVGGGDSSAWMLTPWSELLRVVHRAAGRGTRLAVLAGCAPVLVPPGRPWVEYPSSGINGTCRRTAASKRCTGRHRG